MNLMKECCIPNLLLFLWIKERSIRAFKTLVRQTVHEIWQTDISNVVRMHDLKGGKEDNEIVLTIY